MPRPPSEDRERAYTAIQAALKATTKPEERFAAAAAVREHFPQVAKRTWQLWVSQVMHGNTLLKQRVDKAMAKLTDEVGAAEGAGEEPAEPPPKAAGKRGRGAAPPEGEYLPGKKGAAASVVSGVTQRFSSPRDVPDAPVDLLRQVEELKLDLEALRECSIREVPGGHVIVDPMSFASSVDQGRRLIELQGKLRRDALSAKRVKGILEAILKMVADESPDLARRLAVRIGDMVKFWRKDFAGL